MRFLMNNNGRGFGGRLSVYNEVAALALKHRIKIAVETGTYRGDTALALAEIFDEVYTIESNRDYYLQSFERLSRSRRVTCCYGNSPDWLRYLLPQFRQPVFLYLDAHWYEYWPILDEIRTVAKTGHTGAIIAIDDFQVPGRPDFGYDTYNGQPLNWGYVRHAVASIYRPPKVFHYYYNDTLEGCTGNGVVFIEPMGEEDSCLTSPPPEV
jgi:predicted O-methyltransferase YrrM